MRNLLVTYGCIINLVVGWSGVVHAQDPPAGRQPAVAAVMVPLRVQLVISRYQGDKPISRVPYTLSVNATDRAGAFSEPSRLRMGVQVPVPPLPTPAPDGKPGVPQTGAPTYRDVGTNIDCAALIVGDGRFKVSVTIEESSLYGDDDKSRAARSTTPVFRQFRVSNVLLLTDGQSDQFATATDKITGESVKMDITLSVLK